MQIAEIVLKYIQALLYPVLIGATILFFRKEISGILTGDFKAKYKDLEFTVKRSQRAISNVKDTQKIAIANIYDNLEQLNSITRSEAPIINIRTILKGMEESLNYWESEVMNLLREKGGRYSEETLIDYYFEFVSDPWRRTHEEKDLREAINTLHQKSFLTRDNGYLNLHALLTSKVE